MRDLLSKLDALVSETSLRDPEDLQAKRKALQDLQMDPVAAEDPEIKQAIIQRKADLEKEAKAKGFSESFEVGDDFGISFSEDFEIATEIVGFVDDGIVIELDETALTHLQANGINLIDGELSESLDEARGPCWVGYKQVGMKKKGGKQVPNCVKEDEQTDESGLQYYTGVKKHGAEYMKKAAEAGRKGASQEELGRLKDRYSKAEKNKAQKEDHGPEHPDAPVNYGEYDREGDMAKDDLRTMDDAVEELYSILTADENLPEWVQSKITKAVDYIDTARDYMKAQKYEEDSVEEYGDTARGQKMLGKVQKRAVDRLIKADDKNKSEPDVAKRDLKTVRKNAATADRAWERMTDLDEQGVAEAEYRGKNVPLGKKLPGDVKKSKVYVRKPNGNIVKVNFGDKKMRIKKSNPARRRSFRARHNCKNPGPRWKARYWSCRSW